jgi:hypothetical protein
VKTIKSWSQDIHRLSLEKGWYDPSNPERTALEFHMLFVSEIAEATEAVRTNSPSFFVSDSGKPEGERVELADAVIRIMDYFESRGWDLETVMAAKHDYNKTRPYRHGGKTK